MLLLEKDRSVVRGCRRYQHVYRVKVELCVKGDKLTSEEVTKIFVELREKVWDGQ